MTRGTFLLITCSSLAVGCAQREAFFRPGEARAVGRDGYVGAAFRVPTGAADAEAMAVAALSPLIGGRVRGAGGARDAWRLAAVIEFRNKREGSVTFLPASVRLEVAGGAPLAPDFVCRIGRGEPLREPVEIRHWHQAGFQAGWTLPVGDALPRGPLALHWAYRCDGRDWPQRTAFVACGPRLAERSLAGDPVGLTTDVDYRRESGVPVLMNVPFVGALFRSGTTVRGRTVRSFGTGIEARGTWWPLEEAAGTGFGAPAPGGGEGR